MIKYKFKKAHLEAYFWIIALLALAFHLPKDTSHFSLCLFKNLGLSFCPGCGLGHSISYFFNGDLQASIDAHPLGILTIIILLFRAYKIIIPDFQIHQ